MNDMCKIAKKLLLINWSCFQNECIRLGSSTLFSGVNGTGKTTILDAMLYLLTANTQFNKAADDKDRSISAYVHGDRKTNGSDRYLRGGPVTSYIAMEFYSPVDKCYFVVAVCIESRSEQDRAESKWFYFQNTTLENINFCTVADGKQITTSRTNLLVKSNPIKTSDFLGRDKAVLQIARVLGIRGDPKKYKEKLLKMTAFDPERNVDKFLQDSVLADVEVNSLAQLREQKSLYEKAKEMFENIKRGKILLETIESKTVEYETQCKAENTRKMMFEYQYLCDNNAQIARKNIALKNLTLEIDGLEKQRLQVEKEFGIAHKALSEIENKNHSLTDSRNRLEESKSRIVEQISKFESEIRNLQQLQIALSNLIIGLHPYMSVPEKQQTVLENLSEPDFSAEEKREVFLDFSNKVALQKDTIYGDQIRLEDNERKLKDEIIEVEYNIRKLESNIVVFPTEAENAKRIIKSEFEKRGIRSDVRFFAELVESLTDEKWRKSIETFLGYKRFNIIVDDDYCEAALEILKDKRLFKTNIVLSDKILETEITELSAAGILVIKNRAARKYANYLLNGIHLCKTMQEVHEYPLGGITPDGFLSKSYTGSYMDIQKTRLCLGNEVVKIQLEQIKKEKESLLQEKNECSKKIEIFKQLKTVIENINWNTKDYNFGSSNELKTAQHDFEEITHQIDELARSPEMIAAIREVEIAQHNFDTAKNRNDDISKEIGQNEERQKSSQKEIDVLNKQKEERRVRYDELVQAHPELEEEMLEEYDRQKKNRNTLIIISEKYLKQLSVDSDNARRQLENIQREYNKISEIDINNCGVAFIPFYRSQLRNVANVKVDEAKEKLDEQSKKLRDVFLHDFVAELNENITTARAEIDSINAELKRIPFGRDIYQFKMIEKPDRQIFFTICENLELYSDEPDLFTQRKESNEQMSSDVEDFLNKILSSEDESDYSDYRNYFTYDMRITSKMGDEETEMDLSKKQGSASGGEKQTPYFIVLAASLMQFYPKNVCCARIAFIDEAFSALSKERIEQMVKFLEENNFQVFYAAPPEKINSIGRYIDNTVTLYTQGKYTKPVEGFKKR